MTRDTGETQFWDPIRYWPGLECEGMTVEANFRTPQGEGYIMGEIIKVDEITDEGELLVPAKLPLWHIVCLGGAEVSWHDVIDYRFVKKD
jgi:hypothetical protein